MPIEIASAFKPLALPYRYKVFYGGRGSSKSWAFAQALLLKGCQEKHFILCTRELQKSIQESVHRLLSTQIDRMGLSKFYEIQKTTIKGLNGTQIVFAGISNNVDEIKSMEGITICWCEEAQKMSEHSWRVLPATIRGAEGLPPPEIWVSYNPYDEMDPTHQRFVINDPPKNSIIVKVGWQDNPWFPQVLRDEMEDDYKNRPLDAPWIWEGECNADYGDSIIQPHWIDASIDAHKKFKGFDVGIKALGFDPADSGKDAKAIALRHGSLVTDVVQWLDGEIPEAVDKAFSYAYDFRAETVIYDGVGVGSAVKMGLDKRIEGKGIQIRSYLGNDAVDWPHEWYPKDSAATVENKKTNKDTFRNLRAQWWWSLRDRFEATYNAVEKGIHTSPENMISLSSDIKDLMVLKSELSRVQRKRGQNSFIQIESKEDMKKRGLRSPNMADSLVMVFANKPIEVDFTPISFQSEWG